MEERVREWKVIWRIAFACRHEVIECWNGFWGWIKEDIPWVWQGGQWLGRWITTWWWLIIIGILGAPGLLQYWDVIESDVMIACYGVILTLYTALYAVAWAQHEFDVTRLENRSNLAFSLVSGEQRISNSHYLVSLSTCKIREQPLFYSVKQILNAAFFPMQLKKGPDSEIRRKIVDILRAYKNWDGANFNYLNIEDMYLSHVSFNRTNLIWSKFNKAKIDQGNFSSCSISSSEFYDSVMENVSIDGSCCTSVSFDGAILKNVRFEGSDLRKSSFENATLMNVCFHKAKFSCSNFKNCTIFDLKEIDGCDFSESIIYKSDLSSIRMKSFIVTEGDNTVIVDDQCTDNSAIESLANMLSKAHTLYESLLPIPVVQMLIDKGKGYLLEENSAATFLEEGGPTTLPTLPDL